MIFCFIFIIVWLLSFLTSAILSLYLGCSAFSFLCSWPIYVSFCSWLFDTSWVTLSYSCCLTFTWILLYFCCHYIFYPFLNMWYPDVFPIFFCWIFPVISFYIFCGVCNIFLPFWFLIVIFNLFFLQLCLHISDFYQLWLLCLYMLSLW